MTSFEARSFLDSIHGYTSARPTGPVPSSDRSTKLGTVDPDYVTGLVRVLFDGETSMSVKGYSWMANYIPQAGDRVMLVPAGQSYVITGKVETHTAFPPAVRIAMHAAYTTFNDVHEVPSVSMSEEGVVSFAGTYKPTGTTAVRGSNGWFVIGSVPRAYAPLFNHTTVTMANDVASWTQVDTDGVITCLNPGGVWNTLGSVSYSNNKKLSWSRPTIASAWNGYRLPSYAKDDAGRVWTRGSAMATVAQKADSTIYTLPVGFRPEFDAYTLTYTAGAASNGFRAVTKAGAVVWKGLSTDTVESYVTLEQAPHYTADTTGWVGASLQNGWQTYGNSTWASPGFRKDYDGFVSLRGLMKLGSTGVAAFTLPPNMRPAKQLVIPTISNGRTIARVDIMPTGEVIPRSGNTAWISLDGLNFIPTP